MQSVHALETRKVSTTERKDDLPAAGNLADAIRSRFRRLGGVELPLPAREPMREPPVPLR
jgi:hypothetical protein